MPEMNRRFLSEGKRKVYSKNENGKEEYVTKCIIQIAKRGILKRKSRGVENCADGLKCEPSLPSKISRAATL